MKSWLRVLGLIAVGFVIGVVCTLGSVGYLLQHPDSIASVLVPGGTADYLNPKSRLARAEKDLAAASDEGERLCALGEAAMMNVEAGSLVKAREYASETLQLASKHATDPSSCFGTAVHKGNLALGRIALRSGDLEMAKKHLLAAGRTPGAPELDSFGPNMSLAKELLEKGERQAPIEYFQLCSVFWKMDNGQLRQWTALAKDGIVPDFGANLVY
jgi:hypothetical protein